ncbi:SGNH/GDSL hydrolase family protein [Bosea sp. BH3]|uniref:SGNH/GDSL hydrolase family protein n=1 Tax=Bosea sp. BH3 TaxID=2871701 RepID=UPI0021CB1CBB|nr:SGNH/GDSL hydrolase family protein [Bosea sp. BH3]MCU4179603.1 SGNH/GDSL hydrolase family protein [Bosea sp. BH3]
MSAAIAAGWVAHGQGPGDGPPPAFEGFRQVRLKTIQSQLDQVQGSYLVILGDSHAERLFMPTLCGLPLVNAGISGATVADVLDLARKIRPPREPEAVLLVVGTNDIWAKRNPETGEAEGRFRSGLDALKQRLTTWGGRRALIAIPPVADKEDALFPRSAAARYSSLLAQSCEPARCTYLDVFGGAPDGARGRAAFSDGVHLRDYAGFMRRREAELCSSLGLATRK